MINVLKNVFTDGVFGSLLRFIFDKVFVNFFQNDIDFKKIDFRNCHLTNLNLDTQKLNNKFLRKTPFRLFSGSLKTVQINFPPLTNLINDSIEVLVDGIDILLVCDSVDYANIEQTVKEQQQQNSPKKTANSDQGEPEIEKEINIYKKIINRILFNMKIRVSNICIRLLSEKPIKYDSITLLPEAPCLLLKVGLVKVHKILDLDSKGVDASFMDTSTRAFKGEVFNSAIFSQTNNYYVEIQCVSAHMLRSSQINSDEYLDAEKPDSDSQAEFPFAYPTLSHPSTFLVFGFGKKTPSKKFYPIFQPGKQEQSEKKLGAEIHLSLTHNASKEIRMSFPEVEIMLDFLLIKHLAKYVEKALECIKALQYFDAMKQKYRNYCEPSDFDGFNGPDEISVRAEATEELHSIEEIHTRTESIESVWNSSVQSLNETHVKIGGCDIDVGFFKSIRRSHNLAQSMGDQEPVEVNKSQIIGEIGQVGINVEALDSVPDIADQIFESSNMTISIRLAGIYTYVLKTASTFLRTEFKRKWIFEQSDSHKLFHKFNLKIPVDYFFVKITKIVVSGRKIDTQKEFSATFSNLKILDVLKVDSLLRGHEREAPHADAKATTKLNFNRIHRCSIDLFSNILPTSIEQSLRMSKRLSSGIQQENSDITPKTNGKGMDSSSQLYVSAIDYVTPEFLQIRRNQPKKIVEFELDDTKEHFSVNCLFKFNVNSQSFKKQFQSADQKHCSYVMYQPYNTPSFENHRFSDHDPHLNFTFKAGETSISAFFPSFYCSFYLKLIIDVANILHNSSDAYFIIEKQYQEFRQELWQRWEKEYHLNSGSLANEFEKGSNKQPIEVDRIINEFRSANGPDKLQIKVDIDSGRVVLLGEHPSEGLDGSQVEKTKSFQGTLLQLFEGESQEAFWKNHTIFSNKFVIVDTGKILGKFQRSTEGPERCSSHVLFEEVGLFYPYKFQSDCSKVKISKILSISAKNHQKENGTVVRLLPSLQFKRKRSFEEEEEKQIHLEHPQADSLEIEESKGGDHGNFNERIDQQSFNEKPESQSDLRRTILSALSRGCEEEERSPEFRAVSVEDEAIFTDLKNERKSTGEKMRMNQTSKETSDLSKEYETHAKFQVAVSLPLIEVYLSNNSINFCSAFVNTSLGYFNQIKQRLKIVLNNERKFYKQYFGKEQSHIEKVKPEHFLSVKTFDLNVYLFDNALPKSEMKFPRNYHNSKWADITRLDESLPDNSADDMMEKARIINEDANLEFAAREFHTVSDSFLRFSFRDMQGMMYKSPHKQFNAFHLDFNNLFVRDKSQPHAEYGSWHNPEKCIPTQVLKTLDFEGEADHTIILYKQGNVDRRQLTAIRSVYECEFLNDFKLTAEAYIMTHDYTVFQNKSLNTASFTVLILKDKKPQSNASEVQASVRVSQLNFRFTQGVKFLNRLKSVVSIADAIKKPVVSKESTESDFSGMPKSKKLAFSLHFAADELMIDVLPVIGRRYYLNKGFTLLGVGPQDLEHQDPEKIFYSKYRLVIALKGISLVAKLDSEVLAIRKLELMNLNCLLKNSPALTPKRLPLILRSLSTEESLFDNGFKQLKALSEFRVIPLQIASILLSFTEQSETRALDVLVGNVAISLASDTILALSQLLDLIKYQIHSDLPKEEQEERKEAARIEDEHWTIEEKEEKEPGQEINKNYMKMLDDIDLDTNFYKPNTENLSHSVRLQEGFDIIEGEKRDKMLRNEKIEAPDRFGFDSDHRSGVANDLNASLSPIKTSLSLSSQNTFIKSNSLRFDEENMHQFSLPSQKTKLKVHLTLESLKIKFLEGKDFLSDPDSPKQQENRLYSEIEEVVVDSTAPEERGGIIIVFGDLILSFYALTPNPELQTNAAFRLALSCEIFEVVDLFDKKFSKINKIVMKHQKTQNLEKIKHDRAALKKYQQENKTSVFNFLDIVVEVFSVNQDACHDIRLFVGIHPIQINFSNHHYYFIKDFSKRLLEFRDKLNLSNRVQSETQKSSKNLGINDANIKTSSKNSKFVRLFVPLAQITNFDVYLNLNLDTNLLNLEGFKDAKLEFKRLTLRAVHDIGTLVQKIRNFYVESATSQLVHIGTVLNLPIARNLSNLAVATFNMIYLPYEYFREDKGIASGLKEGVGGFARSVASEGLSFTEFMTSTVANLISLTGIVRKIETTRITRAFDNVRSYIDSETTGAPTYQSKYKF